MLEQLDYPPLIIDSFAGGGGASTGIEMALGRSPDIAVNHNPAALALHAANHPQTLHLSENVYKVDPLDYVRGKHIGLAWFSPDCKHFSKAKGGKPVERNIRDLAWIIPGWVERIQESGGSVDIVILENVEEFQDWGPMVETERGLMPCPKGRGKTFERWRQTLRKLGGKIEWRELRACDYGAPTIRKRLFVIIRFDGEKIVWPRPTHGKPDDPDVIAGRKLPWRTAAEIIDWSLPCPSIFDTSDEVFARHGLRAVRPLADATMSRVARGVKRYVLDAKKPFLVSVAHGYSGGRREYPLDDPMATVTSGGISHAVVAPSVVRFNTGATGHDAREPLATVTANSFVKRPGGAAPLGVDGRRDGGVNPGRPASEPMSTITATPQQGVIAASLLNLKGSDRRDRPADAPHPAVLAGGGHSALLAPHLMAMRNAGKPFNGASEPAHTITAGGAGLSMVAPFITKYYGVEQESGHDEPLHTATGKARFGHVESNLAAEPFTEAVAIRARQVADFLRAHGFWPLDDGSGEREFVTVEIGGETFTIVDIGMRMLTPRELFNAQGFPPDYIIDLDFNGKPLPKSDQISCCGNSVSPPIAAALVSANCQHLAAWLEAAE